MIRVLGDHVLVVLPPKEEQQDEATGYTYQPTGEASGLILAKPADVYNAEIATRGIVVGLGYKREQVSLSDAIHALDDLDWSKSDPRTVAAAALYNLFPAGFDLEIGDCVLFPASAGDSVLLDGIEHVILRESQIIAIVEPLDKSEAA